MTTAPTHPRIMGSWVQADDSMYTIEFAPTTQTGVIALRDSYDQRVVIFATDKQLIKLAEAVQAGHIRHIVR